MSIFFFQSMDYEKKNICNYGVWKHLVKLVIMILLPCFQVILEILESIDQQSAVPFESADWSTAFICMIVDILNRENGQSLFVRVECDLHKHIYNFAKCRKECLS